MQSDSAPDSGPSLTDPQNRSAQQLLADARRAFSEQRFSQAAVLGYLALRGTTPGERLDPAAEARAHLLLSETMGAFQYRGLERIHAKAAMRALERADPSEADRAEGRILLRLGVVTANGGDFPVAEHYLRRGLAAFEAERPPNRQAVIATLLELARLSLRQANVLHVLDGAGVERLGEAAAYVDRAFTLADETENGDSWMGPILELQARMLLHGSSHLPSEHRKTAEEMLVKAESMLRLSLQRRGEGLEDPSGRLAVLNDLVSVLRRTGRLVEAVEIGERALNVTDRLQRMDIDVAANLALTAAALPRSQTLLDVCNVVMSQEVRQVAEVSSFSTEALALAFSAQARHRSTMCLYFLSESAAGDEAVARAMLDLVLRRKAIITDAEGVFRDTLARQAAADLQQACSNLTALRNRLSTKAATGDLDGTWRLVREIERGEEMISATSWWWAFRAGEGEPGERESITEYAEKILAGASPWDAIASLEQPLAGDEDEEAVDAVVRRLPADGALVEFIRLEEFDHERELFKDSARYWALIARPGGAVSAVDMGDASRLETAIDARLEALHSADVTDADAQTTAMSELYRSVWAPIAGELGDADRVILGTDGALALVPFGALVGPNGRFVIEDHTVYLISSGRELMASDRPGAGVGRAVIVADPDFDAVPAAVGPGASDGRKVAVTQPLARLEATAVEGKKVAGILGDEIDLLTGAEATEGRVSALRSPRVLHLATHGLFDEAARSVDESALGEADAVAVKGAYVSHVRMLSRSGLALAGVNHGGTDVDQDGLLTAFDVAGMNLADTELAVLSGCDTGLGNPSAGEGVLGLRRAFRIAGARFVVMSLWRLKDYEAERQIRSFYEKYVAGADPVDALHGMQRERIAWFRAALDGQAPPALWGAWTVQGAPGTAREQSGRSRD